MYKYVFRRIYQLIIVFFLFLVTSYVLFDSIPGNAFQSLLLNPELPREAYDLVIHYLLAARGDSDLFHKPFRLGGKEAVRSGHP